jgi:phage regulator Rha-like protein
MSLFIANVHHRAYDNIIREINEIKRQGSDNQPNEGEENEKENQDAHRPSNRAANRGAIEILLISRLAVI